MVEHVVGLSADSKLDPLTQLEVLEQAHVHIEEMRPDVLVTPLRRVARSCPRRGIQERCCIQTRLRGAANACGSFAATKLPGGVAGENRGTQDRRGPIDDATV